MRYITLIIAVFLALYFIYCTYKEIKLNGKISWKDIKLPLLGIAVALFVIDQVLRR